MTTFTDELHIGLNSTLTRAHPQIKISPVYLNSIQLRTRIAACNCGKPAQTLFALRPDQINNEIKLRGPHLLAVAVGNFRKVYLYPSTSEKRVSNGVSE